MSQHKKFLDKKHWVIIGNNADAMDNVVDLKAENERLRSASFVTAVPSEEYERLKAENERLRKAGDELYLICQLLAKGKSEPARKAWYNAKKEGRNAK